MPVLHFDKIAGNEQSILIKPFKRQSWKKEGGSFDPSPNPRKDNAKQPPIRIESSIRIAKAAARFAPEEWPAKQKGGISIKGFQKRGAITIRIEDVLKQKPRHGYRRARGVVFQSIDLATQESALAKKFPGFSIPQDSFSDNH